MSSDDNTQEEYFYPNSWARIIMLSAEEIVGKAGVNAMLHMAGLSEYVNNFPPDNMRKEFSFEKIGRLQQAFWDMYGPRGARVFATRAGEKSLKDNLDKFGSVARAAQAAMRVGSMERKLSLALAIFAKFFNTVSDQRVSLGGTDTEWHWNIERCPMCTGRTADQPVCHLAVGVLQGAFTWASGGRRFRIAPTHCKAMGHDMGVIVIEKEPVN